MFYSQFILAKKGPLGTIWIAAHLERKLRKNQVADTDIGVSVDSILFPDVPIALRLSSHLLLGVVRIYSRKVNYLFDDCSEALLKIKQAFRSTAVDLPPEESTAPYHSITLPETFDLDDFELPDNDLFQGNYVDHHISSRDQITLQDTMDGVVYSTSQFGLDERFGDGDTSGLDLDEELFLKQVPAVEHDGLMMNSDADPQSSTQAMTSLKDDENEKMNESSEIIETSARYNQIESIAGVANGIEYAQAPSTPGLVEEPNLSNIQETSACDDHLEPENHCLTEFSRKENLDNVSSKSGLYLENRNVMDDCLLSDVNPNPGVILLSKENGSLASEMESNQANLQKELDSNTTTMEQKSSRKFDKSFAATHIPDRVEDLQNGVVSSDEPVVHSDAKAHENSLELEEVRLIGCSTGISSLNTTLQPENNDQAALKAELSNHMDTAGHLGKSSGNASDSNTESRSVLELEQAKDQDSTGKSNDPMIMNPSAHENGACIVPTSGGDKPFDHDLQSEITDTGSIETSGRQEDSCALKSTTIVIQDKEHLGTNGSKQVESVTTLDSQSENVNVCASSEFPAPEKLLSVAEEDLHNNLLFEATPDQSTAQTDGINDASLTVSGKKRTFTESAMTMQSLNSVQSSTIVRTKRTPESVPDDDDLLSSILVGRKSSVLKVKDTPLPDMSLKRHRSAPRTSAHKRKVLMDDTMVLHGDMIRLQLTNTEDIRRVRKKAPCTRPEILMIQKQFLEDEIFNETIFTGVSAEFSSLHNQTYDLSELRITMKDENNASSGLARELRSLDDEFNAYLEASKNKDLSVEPPLTKETGKAGSTDLMEVRGDSEAQAVEMPVTGSGHEEHTARLKEPTSNEAEAKSSQECFGEITEMDIDGKNILEVDAVNNDATVNVFNTGEMTGAISQLGSSDKTDGPDASLPNDALESIADQPLCVEIKANDFENNLDEVEHALRMNEEVLSRALEGGASVEIGTDIQTEGVAHSPTLNPSTTFSPEMGGCNTETVTVDHIMEDVSQVVVQEVSHLDAEVDYNATNNLVTDEFCGEERIIDSSHPADTVAELEDNFVDNGQTSFFDEASQFNAQDVGEFTTEVDRYDFDNLAPEHDTGFLNYDDDDEEAEADDEGVPNAADARFIENSGWSSRTRAVAKYLQTVFEKEPEQKKVIPIDNLLVGKSRKEASRMFFEALVLKTKDYIHVEQKSPYSNINILPRAKLMKSDF